MVGSCIFTLHYAGFHYFSVHSYRESSVRTPKIPKVCIYILKTKIKKSGFSGPKIMS